MTRERMSRPTWSVPKCASSSGALLMRVKFALSGSRSAERSLGAAMGASTRSTVALTSVPDTRIEPRVREIHEDVDDDEDRRVEQHEVLHHDDVALDNRGDERASEARDAERLLDG